MLENKWLKQIFYFLLSCYTFLWSPSGQKFWSCPCYLSPSFFPWNHSSIHYDQAVWIWLSWHGFYGQITLFCKVLTCQLSTHHLVGSLTYIHCWNISFSGLPWHHKLLILSYHSSSSFSISIVPQSSVFFFFSPLFLSLVISRPMALDACRMLMTPKFIQFWPFLSVPDSYIQSSTRRLFLDSISNLIFLQHENGNAVLCPTLCGPMGFPR